MMFIIGMYDRRYNEVKTTLEEMQDKSLCDKKEADRRRCRASMKWQKLYTMLNNRSISVYSKRYCQYHDGKPDYGKIESNLWKILEQNSSERMLEKSATIINESILPPVIDV